MILFYPINRQNYIQILDSKKLSVNLYPDNPTLAGSYGWPNLQIHAMLNLGWCG